MAIAQHYLTESVILLEAIPIMVLSLYCFGTTKSCSHPAAYRGTLRKVEFYNCICNIYTYIHTYFHIFILQRVPWLMVYLFH